MRISRIEIEGFGKLKNFTLDFSENFQIVFGKNEDGKSTIMAFIELMFYGNTPRTKDIERNFRIKYRPWDNSPMGGTIIFTKNNKSYRLHKLFGKTFGQDKVSLIDNTSGDDVAIDNKVEVGKHFFGIDVDGFRRSSFIGQLGAIRVDKNSGDEIAEKLMKNVAQTGTEEYSADDVITRLQDAKFKLISKNTKGGLLAESKSRLASLKSQLESTIFALKNIESLTVSYNNFLKLEEEKKSLISRVSLHENLSKKDKLNELLSLSIQHQSSLSDIQRYGLSADTAADFIAHQREMLALVESKTGKIGALKSSLPTENLVPISPEEKMEAERISTEILKLTSMSDMFKSLNSAQSISLNKISKRDKIQAEFDEVQNNIKVMAPQIEQIKTSEVELHKNQNAVETLKNSLDNQEIFWAKRINFETEKIQIEYDQLAKASKPKPISALLMIAVLVAIASIVAGVALNKFAFAGIPVAVALAVAHFLLSGRKGAHKNLPMPISPSLSASMTALEQEIESEKNKINHEISDVENKIVEHEAIISTAPNAKAQFSQLRSSLDEAKSQLFSCENSVAFAAQNCDKIVAELRENNDELTSPIDAENLEDIPSLVKTVDTAKAELIHSLDEIFASKKSENIEDFLKKYSAYCGNIKTVKEIEKLSMERQKCIDDFLNEMKIIHGNSTFEQSKSDLNDFDCKLKLIFEHSSQLIQTAKALELPSFDVVYLKNMIAEIESANAYEHNSANGNDENRPYEIDEIKELIATLNSQNIEENLRELASKIRLPEPTLEHIEEEIIELENKICEMQQYFDSLSLALEMMEDAREEMRESFGPDLRGFTAKNLAKLTGNKYSEVLINKSYEVRVKSDFHFQDSRFLSSGTIDQIYLSLRLAIAELISQKQSDMPILLDDVLSQYDASRLENALRFLSDYSRENSAQIVLFTCHDYIITSGESYNIPYKKII